METRTSENEVVEAQPDAVVQSEQQQAASTSRISFARLQTGAELNGTEVWTAAGLVFRRT